MSSAYFISDSWALTGPSIVNSYYRKYLGDRYEFAPAYEGTLARVVHDITHIINSKVIVFSGASKLDLFYLKICRLLKRRILYIMHGCIQEENAINHVDDHGAIKLEKQYLKSADLIACVSPSFTEWVKIRFPEYHNKIITLANGIDWNLLNRNISTKVRDNNTISIVGGGVPRKNVLAVCRAVEIINQTKEPKMQMIVFGRDDLDSDRIKKYSFVEFNGKIPREEMLRKISSTILFVQNSRFDSFALAPFEALTVGCNILCSKNVGALSIMNGVNDCDIIQNCDDEKEIAEKILYLLDHPNHDRLICAIDKTATSFETRAAELNRYIIKLAEEE